MTRPARQLTVALDVTPLVTARTGIGHFVHELVGALRALEGGPDLLPYVLSRRARIGAHGEGDSGGEGAGVRLPLPAGLAVRLWGRLGGPALDGRLGASRVVHGTNFVAPPSRRRAVVVTVHDLAFARFPDLCSPAALAAGRVARRLAHRGAWVHTPSEYVATEVREAFATERVRAVHHGVPALAPAEAAPAEAAELVGGGPFLLALGTLEPRKRHAALVEAFGRVAASHPGLRLILAGPDGPARPDVDAAIGELAGEVRARVVLTGHVSDLTRAALLRHAEVFAYPSRYEGFGLPVLEAMSAGTPVVTSRGGGVPECAGEAALLIGRGDGEGGEDREEVDELAGALDRVLGDTSLRDRLVAAGRERARGFTWDATARGIMALYEEAAST